MLIIQAKKLRELWKKQFKAEGGEGQKLEASTAAAGNIKTGGVVTGTEGV